MLLSALALPLARRRGVPVARLFRLAVIMAAAIILTWEVIVVMVTQVPAAATAGSAHSVTGTAHSFSGTIDIHAMNGSLRVPIIAISASIMVLVIATGAALLRLVGVKPTPTPPPIEAALPPALPGGHSRRRPAPSLCQRRGP